LGGGTTYGNVYVTGDPTYEVTNTVIAHEDVHVTQWSKAGSSFLPLYGAFQAIAEFKWAEGNVLGTNGKCLNAGCYNPFEQAAGLNLGGYQSPNWESGLPH
jgi:hypothetical protein